MAASSTTRPARSAARRLAAAWMAAILALTALGVLPGAAAAAVDPAQQTGCSTVTLSTPSDLVARVSLADCGDPVDTTFQVVVSLLRQKGSIQEPEVDPVVTTWSSLAPVGAWVTGEDVPVPQGGLYYLRVDAFSIAYGGTPVAYPSLAIRGGTWVTVSKPVLHIRTGKLSSAGVPARVTWTNTSNNAQFNFGYRVNGGPLVNTFDTAFNLVVKPGATYTIEVFGRNVNGVKGPVQTATFHPKAFNESSWRFAYTGTWRSAYNTGFWGGRTRFAKAAGATTAFTFTGREVAFVVPMGPTRGSFRAYVATESGAISMKTVSTYSASTLYRRVLYLIRWAEPGTHTVILKVLGTAGHPRVDIDGAVTVD